MSDFTVTNASDILHVGVQSRNVLNLCDGENLKASSNNETIPRNILGSFKGKMSENKIKIAANRHKSIRDLEFVPLNLVESEPYKYAIVCEPCDTIFESDANVEQHSSKTATHMIQEEHKSSHSHEKPVKKETHTNNSNEYQSNSQSHCSVCNTTFLSAKNLKLHMKMHAKPHTKTIDEATLGEPNSPIEKFFCDICKKSFNHSLFFVHQNMHRNVEEHNCCLCNRQFENQVSYDMHMQLHADQPIKIRTQVTKPGANFVCNYCGKDFLRPHEKVKHERIHTGEKPYECEVCGKSFRVSYSLTLHLRTHTDVRPFVCPHCNKRFKSYAVYSHHINTHSEDRPYKCPMCPKSFRTSVQLCGHKNSHTKPYNCPECNRPFSSLYSVKIHMKTHNKANKSNENLKHRCDICGAVYARTFALRFHIKEQHLKNLNGDHASAKKETSKDSNVVCKSEDDILSEEVVIDHFQSEDTVTDWLTQK